MNKLALTLGILVAFMTPLRAEADNSAAYIECQHACAGNGLSCVRRCLGQQAAGSPVGNTNVIVAGNSAGNSPYKNYSYRTYHQPSRIRSKARNFCPSRSFIHPH